MLARCGASRQQRGQFLLLGIGPIAGIWFSGHAASVTTHSYPKNPPLRFRTLPHAPCVSHLAQWKSLPVAHRGQPVVEGIVPPMQVEPVGLLVGVYSLHDLR